MKRVEMVRHHTEFVQAYVEVVAPMVLSAMVEEGYVDVAEGAMKAAEHGAGERCDPDTVERPRRTGWRRRAGRTNKTWSVPRRCSRTSTRIGRPWKKR